MFPCAGFGFGLWWIFPSIMIVMMVLCVFMVRGRMGTMICRGAGSHGKDAADPAFETLKTRYARGEIDKEEYEEKKKVITGQN